MKKSKQHITIKTKTEADNSRSNGNAGYNFGGGIYSIVGIVTRGEVNSHINYWNDKKKLGHNDLYPNKFFGRWLWTCGIPEMFLDKSSSYLDEDENLLVFEHVRNILIAHQVDVTDYDKFMGDLLSRQ
jgi:hypothetical protein